MMLLVQITVSSIHNSYQEIDYISNFDIECYHIESFAVGLGFVPNIYEYKSCSHTLTNGFWLTLSCNSLFECGKDFSSLSFDIVIVLGKCVLPKCNTWTVSNVIDYEMVNFMACFTHTISLHRFNQFNRFVIEPLTCTSATLNIESFFYICLWDRDRECGNSNSQFSHCLWNWYFIGKKIFITLLIDSQSSSRLVAAIPNSHLRFSKMMKWPNFILKPSLQCESGLNFLANTDILCSFTKRW